MSGLRPVLLAGVLVLVGSPGAAALSGNRPGAPSVEHHRHRDRHDRDDDGEDGRQVCFAFCDDVIVIPGLPGMGGKSVACVVPAPWHCDPRRQASLITNPGKIVEFPVTVVEMSLQFAQSLLKLVVADPAGR